ncbi:hypothetical protein GN958_ATG18624 [Phytophthora infestans]|uniref:Reverse transcriptase Ty1/copia-type domain-containing protein n=1 Tax=Phytophthora infestans TaxID=4787 RepID=A0A8S9TTP9_PHYIN|nr:hypothetical protein GN958_ATG18624 [Phytophthora infestans]
MRDEDIVSFKAAMEAAFEVNHFEDVNFFLGLELTWSPNGDAVCVGQRKYSHTILERFGMEKTRSAATPMEERYRDKLFLDEDIYEFKPLPAIGALLYLSVISRPDLATAIRLLAQETERPTRVVEDGINRVILYLNGTRDFGLNSSNVMKADLSCIVMLLFRWNWGSKKQSMVTLSSTEAEYIAMGTGVQECIGLNMVLKDLRMEAGEILVFEDNQGAQHLAESKAVTQQSRHINTKYHWLRQKVKEHEIRIQYCPTSEMVADHFTKPLGTIKFKHFRDELGVRRVGVLDQNGASSPIGQRSGDSSSIDD